MDFSSTGSPKWKKMHQCDFCNKLFSTASNMREHRRTHTGEKPFVCRYCGKAFAQSSTHSKHQLVHKSKEKFGTSRGHLVKRLTGEHQEKNSSEPSLTTLAESSTSQPQTAPSLLPSKTFIKTLQKHEQSKMKTEIDFLDNLDWDNSNSVFSRSVDTSLHFNNIHDAAITPASSFSVANDNEQRSFADQKPVIIGMFKNRACTFSPPVEIMNLQVKQEASEVKNINLESSSFLNELDLPGNKELIQHKKVENKTLEALSLSFPDEKTINYDADNKAFHSTLPQTVLSKAIDSDNRAAWNEGTPIIQLDLTSNGDTLPGMQDKFQGNTETFFKCIHCSETFSSLEEHICLAKEAKMFFKCQICQKTFSQYGPFFRHKQNHENCKQFTASSSTHTAEKYQNCEMADNIKKESNDVSQVTDSLYSRQQTKEASHAVDLPVAPFPSELSRRQSSKQLGDEEQNSDDDVIIIEANTIQRRSKDILENPATVKKPREKLSSIPTYANTDQFPNSEGRYFEKPNISTGDMVKPQRRALISEPLLKPNVAEKKTSNVSHLGKRQAHLKKNLQPLGKKGYPFTCLFCPRKFSTASNMREHMRVHTGEKPFSCELCHKKFAQSSTRSKHMQTHRNHRMSNYLNGKKFIQTKNYKKYLRRSTKHNDNSKSLMPNRLSNNKEKSKVHPVRSSMKTTWNKSDSSLLYPKADQPVIKENAFKMMPEPSNTFSFPPKTASNKIPSLNAKLIRQDGVFNNNQFGFNEEGTSRMNVSHEKMTDYVLMNNNNQNLKNKMSFPSVVHSDSNVSLFSSSIVKSKTDHLLSPGFPRPRSRHRGAHKLLRNARSYRPFRCKFCPRTFSTLGNMKEHMRTHTGEKPFRCEYCHRCFAQSSTHSKHVQVHIRKQQLNCFFCGKFFSQVALLRDHIVTEHKEITENSTRNNNLSVSLCGSSTFGMVNKNRPSFSLGSNAQSESFLDSDKKNQCLQNNKLKKNKIIELPDSNLEKNIMDYELGSSLTEKRLLQVDLPANTTGFQIQEKTQSFLSLQETEDSNCFPEKDVSKNISAEIIEINKDAPKSTKSYINKDFLISRSNLSNCTSEAVCVTSQLDSEMFEELLTKRARLATPAKTRIQQQQSQIKNDSLSLFELTQIKSNNPELSSVTELDSSKSLTEDANMYSEIKPLVGSSSEDLNTRMTLSMKEELNKCTNSGEQVKDNIFLNDYSYLDPLNNLTGIEIQPENKQKNLTKLQRGSPLNINEDNLMHYNQTLGSFDVELQAKRNTSTNQPCNQYVQNKVGMYNSLLNKEKNLYQHVSSSFLKSDQQLSSGSFTSPAHVNKNSADHLLADAQTDTINKIGKEALVIFNNVQENDTFVSSLVPSCERSLPSPASHVEQSLDSNIPDHKAKEQSLTPLLNSELSLNPYSGDSAQKLNWFLDTDRPETTTTTKREERTSEFGENCNSQILCSNIENSFQARSVSILPNDIKLERNVLNTDTEQGCINNVQVKDVTSLDLSKAASIDGSLDSGLHFNISNITANAQYPLVTDTNSNEIVIDDSQPSSEKMGTICLNDKANLQRISSSESTSIDNSILPNNVKTSSMASCEKNGKALQHRIIARKFKCIYCSRCFSSRSNMKEHMRIHTGEKPFECVFCFRRFAQSSTHSKHVQTHLQYRQLVCPQCGKRFLQANNLYQHIKIQHRTSHTSATSSTKKPPLCLDSMPSTARSCQKRQSSNNKDKYSYSVNSKKNDQEVINVNEVSVQNQTNNNLKYYTIQQSLSQSNEETSNNLSKTQIQSTSEDEKTRSKIDIDLDKNNVIIDINDFSLNNSGDKLPEINKDPQFLSKHSILNSIQTLDTKNNLQNPSDSSFDKKSSNCDIYQETLAPSKAVCQYEKTVCKKNDPHESNKYLLEASGKSNVSKTQSPKFEFKCEICSEEFSSDDLLNLHHQRHIINLAKRRGFNLKASDIQDLDHCINFRKSLKENQIRSLDELEDAFEKIAADLGLKKLSEKHCQAQQEESSSSQQTADKELSQDGEKNDFDSSHPLCKHSNLTSLSFSPSSSSSSVSLVSATEPKKEPKKSSWLHFHKCSFCSKMFDALITLQEHLRTHMKDDASLQTKFNRKFKECTIWYKHVEIVLGSKLRLPAQTSVENAQHLKVMFDISERFKMLLHRNIYKCRHCSKEYATFHSLLFHRHTHSRKLAGQKIPTHVSGKLTKKGHGPSGFLHKRPTSSLIFCLEPIFPDSKGHSFSLEKQEESHKTLVPLLCFSLDRQFWLVNLNGTLTALGSYTQYLPADKSLTTITEIGSGKLHHLEDLADSPQQTLNQSLSISCLEEVANAADQTDKSYFNDKLEWSLNNLEDNSMKNYLNDDNAKNKGVLLSQSILSSGVNNSGVIKLFGQKVTTVVSLQFQKFADAGHLKRKLQIHSRNLLFPCKFCSKSFSHLSTFRRHVNLIHTWNQEYCIPNCRNDNPSSKNKNDPSGMEESLESKYHQIKTQSTLDMNLGDTDKAYLELKKVMGCRTKVFSGLPFAHRSKESKISERMEYPSTFSDKQLTESSVNHLSQPLQLQESNLNIGITEKFQSEKKELADKMNFVEADESNKTAQGTCVTDIFLTEVQLNKDEENFSLSHDPKAVYKSSTNVKRKIIVGPKVTTFPSQLSSPVENEVNSKQDFEVQRNSNGEVDEKHLKENSTVECIFINDDPDDPSLDESRTSARQYLPNCSTKLDTSTEIIIVSDEENDDESTQGKMQSLNNRNSSVNICDNTDDAFLSWLKENRMEDQAKDDSKDLQDVYKTVNMSFKNCKLGFSEITNQKFRPDLNDHFETVPTTLPLQISSIASNSSRVVDSFSKKTSYQSKSSLAGKVHPCLYCSKTCSSTSNLKEHMRSHTGERPFSCSVCHKKFAQKSTLSKHTQIHARYRKLSHVGVNSQKSSPVANPDLAEPIPTNSLKPPFNLAEHSSLTNQLKIEHISDITTDPKHTTLKSNTNCDSPQINCDSLYSSDKNDSDIKSITSFESDQPVVTQSSEIINNPSSSSHNHLLTSGIYPLLQSSANVFTYKPVFTKVDPIRPHISYVVPESRVSNKPYSCDICHRTFTTSGNLKEHRRTHTGERPFECPFCEKTFVQASTRSRHVKNHSKHIAN